MAAFNDAVRPGTVNHAALDDCRTDGLTPEKIALGAADRHAAVLGLSAAAGHHLHLPWGARGRAGAHHDARGRPARNIFAAGEVMAGNILRKGYLAGSG